MSEFIFPGIKILIKELQCPCCGQLPPDLYTDDFYLTSFNVWQVIRDEWGKPIPISRGGGYRCPKYQLNLILSGKTKACCSPHYFWALDNDLDSAMECEEFVDLVDRLFPDLRIGYLSYINAGKSFVHLDNAYLVKPKPNPSWIKGVRW